MTGWRKLAVGSAVVLMFLAIAPAASAFINDICLSFGGYEIYQSGDAGCSTTSGNNFAAALGAGSTAEAEDGDGNTAIALHDSHAEANEGEGLFGFAIYNSTAEAEEGTGNVAIAAHGSVAEADSGDHNTSIALYGSAAEVEEGNNNIAIAKDDSEAWAGEGDGNKAIALHGSEALAGSDSGESSSVLCAAAPVSESGSVQCAEPRGDDNTAIAIDDSFACAGYFQDCQPEIPCGHSASGVADCGGTHVAFHDSADGNTAVAVHSSDAYAGGDGFYDLNTAIATWNCVAEAIFGTELLDYCGPHHGSSEP